jgi:enamine deaminase RidA (YjgF/YER057c/UK114 family)
MQFRRIMFSVLVSLMPLFAVDLSAKEVVKMGAGLGLPFSPAVKAGNFVYVSGALATDEKGRLVPGTIQEQTKRVLNHLGAVLKASGSRLENVASVSVYLRNAADFEAMNEVYRGFWAKDPPTRTTVVTDLVRPEALVEIAMVAIKDGAERRVVHPAGWNKSPNYSYGIQSGDTLFLAGLVARNMKDNSSVAGDIGLQTQTVLSNAGEILKAAGMTHADVASSRVFITDAAKFQDMNTAYRPFFPKDPPARATVKAALMNPSFQVEITLLAVKSSDREAINPPGADGKPARPSPNYSSGIRVGNRLYVAGMVGSTESNKGDMQAQTRESLNNIGRTIKAAGFDWSQVVEGIVYVTEVGLFSAMNEAYRETFTKDFPARTTVGIEIVIPDPLVEIMLTAVK